MYLLYATQTTLYRPWALLSYHKDPLLRGPLLALEWRYIFVRRMDVDIGPVTTISEVRNNTHYTRPGELSFGDRRHMLSTLGEALGVLAEEALVIPDRYRLYHLVERYNLLVKEQYEEGRDTSTCMYSSYKTSCVWFYGPLSICQTFQLNKLGNSSSCITF